MTDMFTPQLPPSEVLAVVLAPATNSALFYEMARGSSLTDHLRKPQRPSRPPEIGEQPVQHLGLDTMTIEQFEARMRRLTDGA